MYIVKLYSKITKFFKEELWSADLTSMPTGRRLLYNFYRFLSVVLNGYQEDKCSLQASGLTYITLVSIVPILAIMMSFSKGLGMQNHIMDIVGLEECQEIDSSGETQVSYRVIQAAPDETETPDSADADSESGEKAKEEDQHKPSFNKNVGELLSIDKNGNQDATGREPGFAAELPEAMQRIIVNIFNYVQKTNFAALGFVGCLMLLVSVITSMSKLEGNFNAIWCIKKARSLPRKISEYLVVILMVPIVLIAVTTLDRLLSSNWLAEQSLLSSLVLMIMGRLLYLLLVLGGFTFFYIFMPNTRVRFVSAMLAGVLTSIFWLVVQWAYIKLQVGLTNYNAIYGTFAVVPFFLAWLYANWSIVLLGGEISFAIQNHQTLCLKRASVRNSHSTNVIIGIMLTNQVCRNFLEQKGAFDAMDFIRTNALPLVNAQAVIETLKNAGVLLAVSGNEPHENELLIPGIPPEKLTLGTIETALRSNSPGDEKQFMNMLPNHLAKQFTARYQDYINSMSAINFKQLIETQVKS